MAHSLHQLAQTLAGGCCHRVAGMTKIMQMQSRQAGLGVVR
jgi:hypothetical protein